MQLAENDGLQSAQTFAAAINQQYPDLLAKPGYNENDTVIRLSLPHSRTAEEASAALQDVLQHTAGLGVAGGAMPDIGPHCGAYQHESMMDRLRGYSGQAASLTWIAGNALLFKSAFHWNDTPQEKKLDHVEFGTATAAIAYALANSVVVLNANRKPRTTDALLKDLDDFLETHENPPLTREEAKEARGLIAEVKEVVRRYPWEIAAAINLGGGMMNFGLSLYDKGKKTVDNGDKGYAEIAQAIGAAAAVTSGLAQLLIPQRSGDRLVDPELIASNMGDHLVVNQLADAGERFPPVKKAGQVMESLLQELSEHRMQVIAGLGSLDNVGFLASALLSRPRNWDKAESQGIAAMGYAFQALARDMQLLEPEQVMFCTALYMDEKLRGKEGEALEKEAKDLAGHIITWLQQQTDVNTQWPEKPAEELYKTWQALDARRKQEATVSEALS